MIIENIKKGLCSIPGWLEDRLKKDLTDPLNQNIANCFCSYAISILLSVLIGLMLSPSSVPGPAVLSRAAAISLFSTTLTQAFSVGIQAHAFVRQGGTPSDWGILLLAATVFYSLLFLIFIRYDYSWLDLYVYIGSVFIAVIGLALLSRASQTRHTRSLSRE